MVPTRNYRSISLLSENGVEFHEVVPGGGGSGHDRRRGGGHRLRGRGGAVAPMQRFSEEQDWYAEHRLLRRRTISGQGGEGVGGLP